MDFYPSTLVKLENLIADISAVYGEEPISFNDLVTLIDSSPQEYPHINTILNKKKYRISKGMYKISLKDDGIEQKVKNDADKLVDALFN